MAINLLKKVFQILTLFERACNQEFRINLYNF